jgi:hypothetical protein
MRRGVQRNIIFFAYNVIYNLDIAGVEAAHGAKIYTGVHTND